MRHHICLAILALSAPLASAAHAETELSFYSGWQTAPHSVVTGNDAALGALDFTAGWDGKSFAMPPYYGFRATWWRSETFGLGVDFNHAKVYADDETLADSGFSRLEFTDGLNILTLNAWRRWPEAWGRLTPYVGAGLGISVPHVDIESGAGHAFGYQLTGPAAQWVVGASMDLNDRWAVFGEYKGTYTMNEVDLEAGGNLSTNIITNALNVGVSYSY